MGRARVVLGWAVSHTQSSHQGLMIREWGATVRVKACGSFESLTGDVEPRNCLGKVKAREGTLLSQRTSSWLSHSLVISELRLDWIQEPNRLVREETRWVRTQCGERPDLVKHIVDADATGKWLQFLLVDVAVVGYHGTTFFRALGE